VSAFTEMPLNEGEMSSLQVSSRELDVGERGF
jgi:hypothetical protein